MRYKGSRQSQNVDDRSGGGGGRVALAGGGIGALIIALLTFFLTGSLGGFGDLITSGLQQQNYSTVNVESDEYKDQKEFASVVFAHLEDYWSEQYPAEGKGEYTLPQLVLFSGSVNSACGTATAQVGPFYCPGDQKVYLDLSFGDELSKRYGASGDYAMAYVLAHEVGHHVQQELGITNQLNRVRQQVNEKTYNKYSVALELQADYLAGMFSRYLGNEKYNGQPILEEGDIEEAITAANAIGDDTLQKQAQGYAVPDSFTHGTSAERVYWFQKGYKYGDLDHANTFEEAGLNIKY